MAFSVEPAAPQTGSTQLLLTPAQVLGPNGLMAGSLEGYQARESQIRMAGAVYDTLRDERELLVEAPTGTGKSLAYLIPAILHAVPNLQRVVIATANIALQEQLVGKDLPFLRDLLPVDFKFALMKGRQQFVCVDKLTEHNSGFFKGGGLAQEDEEEFRAVLDWANKTGSGDVSELDFKPGPRVWRQFAVTDTGECAGCELPCFHKAAIEAAADADIVVTNYHLLFADLQVRMRTADRARVLPPYDILIADEAHEIPEIGANFAGEDIGRWSFRSLKSFLSGETWERLDQAAERFARALNAARFRETNRVRITRPGCADPSELLLCVDQARRELQSVKKGEDPEGKRYKQLERREAQCREACRKIKFLVDQEDPEWVYWVETWAPKAGPTLGKLCGKPVSVAKHLAANLFPQLQAFVGTSATLTTTRNDFSFIRDRLGLPEGRTRQLILPSPFDFRSSALVVVPDQLPEPNAEDFRDRMIDTLARAVPAAGGRSLLLFTSNAAMQEAWHALEPEFGRLGYRCFRQGSAPSTVLIQRFKDDVSSVLFATRTFFQGIDVPGEALSLVALDRLPFPSPADPVMDWIAEHDPKGWFFRHSLPLSLITFKQIFGRLIRRDTDRGVMLLMDGRVKTKRYGHQFLKSIPGGMLSTEIQAIQSFLSDDDDPFS